jgi:hypothetical protein
MGAALAIKSRISLLRFCWLTGLVAIAGPSVYAQSTIFNIPSTDVVEKKKTYLEFDFISHLESHENGGFQTYVPRAVYGLRKGVELGMNLGITASAGPSQVFAQPNLKWQVLSSEGSGVAMTTGAIAYIPLRERAANDTCGLFYVNASKKFKGLYGPRLTAGAYGLGGISVDGMDKGGAILGYEQPVTKKVNFVGDWFSGKNGFGYVTPGLSITLPKSGLFNAGYSIGNFGRKNNGLFFYYGVTL